MVIRYADGSFVECVIHRLEGRSLRAVVAGVEDAVEYTLVRDQWMSESGRVVTFEFRPDPTATTHLCQITPPKLLEGVHRCAAGGDCVLRRMSNTSPGPVN